MILRLLFVLPFLFLMACGNGNKNNDKQPEPEKIKESLAKANEHMVKVENEDIANYMRRHELDMHQTGTGLRFMKYKQGSGKQVRSGDKVTINYKVNLINGVVCYSSLEDGPLIFETGKDEVINGLEEAILMMGTGDKAKVIIPSHLAYGLLGDEDLIPKRATLVYDVEVVKIN